MDTKVEESWFAGPTATVQEPSFIPREGGGEGEGWIIALLNHLDVLRNDIVILDAQDLAKGPVATIHLPLKLKLGLHGNFVEQREIEECEFPPAYRLHKAVAFFALLPHAPRVCIADTVPVCLVAKRRGPSGDLGPVKIAERPLLWQEKAAQEQHGGINGVGATTNGVNGEH
jgi:hypothetical protein